MVAKKLYSKIAKLVMETELRAKHQTKKKKNQKKNKTIVV